MKIQYASFVFGPKPFNMKWMCNAAAAHASAQQTGPKLDTMSQALFRGLL